MIAEEIAEIPMLFAYGAKGYANGDYTDFKFQAAGVLLPFIPGKVFKSIYNKFPLEPIPFDRKLIESSITDGKIIVPNGVQNLDFVITKSGDLRLGKKHHFLGDRNDVLAAGQIKLDGQGQVRRIDNWSGHYQPTSEDALSFPELFEALGIDTKKATLERSDFITNENGEIIREIKQPAKKL